jgi:hypothetical protein
VINLTSRRVGALVTALVATTALAGCLGGDDDAGFKEDVRGGGANSSIQFGGASLPADFPSAQVPLPDAGRLQAVVSEGRPPNRFYTFTYGLGGRSGTAVGTEYRNALERAGFKIQNFSTISGDDVRLTSFDAIGDRWDVSVASGKASRPEPQTLSVQVTTHGTLVPSLDELRELDEGPTGAGNLDDLDGGLDDPAASSTTTTSTP